METIEEALASARVSQKLTGLKVRNMSERAGRRGVRRPEQILEDVRGLKLRQRVSLVLGDEVLKQELEEITKNFAVNGSPGVNGVRTYQDFLLPTLHGGYYYGGANVGAVKPINDIRGADTLKYSKREKIARCKLASLYRLVDLMGWSESVYNHISLRVSDEHHHFLLNPYGLFYNEVTASSLKKIDLEGNEIETGSTSLGVLIPGFILHSAIHQARKDAKCVIHVHTPPVVAVSAMKCGFLKISQEAAIIGDVSYHTYCGILVDEEEKEAIANDLGPTNRVMFLTNHGVVCIGETIEEAFQSLFNVIYACEAQVRAMAVGIDNLHIMSDEVAEAAYKINQKGQEMKTKEWALGQIEFEAFMRWMDAQGYNTGYPYKKPDVFIASKPPQVNASQVPPSSTTYNQPKNITDLYYELDKGSPIRRAHSMGRANTYKNRIRWLNSPVLGTRYQKEVVERQPPSLIIQKKEEESPKQEEQTLTRKTEIVQQGTSTVTTVVTKKVVTVIDGEESVIEDSQVIVDGESKPVTSTVTEKVVVIDEKEGNKGDKPAPVSVNGPATPEVRVNGSAEEEHTDGHLSPGSPTSHHSSRSEGVDEEGVGSQDEGEKSSKKVKKQRSFKKALIKKFKK